MPLTLPDPHRKPRFNFGDSVVIVGGEFGTVVGVIYLDRVWSYLVKLHPDSSQAGENPLLQVPQDKLSAW